MYKMTAPLLALLLALSAVHAQQNAPQATKATVAEMIAGNTSAPISIFLEAIRAAEVYDQVTGASFTGTLLIPTDDAFRKLLTALPASKEELLKEKVLLKRLLQYHVSPTVVPRAENFANFANTTLLPTLLPGRGLQGFSLPNGSLVIKGEINKAAVVSYGIAGLTGSGATINAAVYTIDTVLVPNITIQTAAPPPPKVAAKPASTNATKNGTATPTATPAASPSPAAAAGASSPSANATAAKSGAVQASSSALVSVLVAVALVLLSLL